MTNDESVAGFDAMCKMRPSAAAFDRGVPLIQKGSLMSLGKGLTLKLLLAVGVMAAAGDEAGARQNVPMARCAAATAPVSPTPDCPVISEFMCWRYDVGPNAGAAGTSDVVAGEQGPWTNCNNSITVTKTKSWQATWTDTRTFTGYVQQHPGDADVSYCESLMEEEVGVDLTRSPTFQETMSAPLPPCESLGWDVGLSVDRDKTASMEHEFNKMYFVTEQNACGTDCDWPGHSGPRSYVNVVASISASTITASVFSGTSGFNTWTEPDCSGCTPAGGGGGEDGNGGGGENE